MRSYEAKNGEVEFGKNFKYNPEKHYFNEQDEKIIKFLRCCDVFAHAS